MLTAEHITVDLGGRPVLRDVDLSLAAGEVVALIGPNGGGKTTLLRALLGTVPAGGRVRWFDRDRWSRRDLAKRVAYLPQSPGWDAGQRAVDVVRLGRTPYVGPFGLETAADAAAVGEAAAVVDAVDLLGRPMDELSGGQRQRVFLARCLAQQPSALLLDEPTTYLDLRYQVELCRQLRALAGRGLGVLMAVHDLTLASLFADRVVLVADGRVVAAGPAADVLTAGQLSAAYGTSLATLSGPNNRPVPVPDMNGGGTPSAG